MDRTFKTWLKNRLDEGQSELLAKSAIEKIGPDVVAQTQKGVSPSDAMKAASEKALNQVASAAANASKKTGDNPTKVASQLGAAAQANAAAKNIDDGDNNQPMKMKKK